MPACLRACFIHRRSATFTFLDQQIALPWRSATGFQFSASVSDVPPTRLTLETHSAASCDTFTDFFPHITYLALAFPGLRLPTRPPTCSRPTASISAHSVYTPTIIPFSAGEARHRPRPALVLLGAQDEPVNNTARGHTLSLSQQTASFPRSEVIAEASREDGGSCRWR